MRSLILIPFIFSLLACGMALPGRNVELEADQASVQVESSLEELRTLAAEIRNERDRSELLAKDMDYLVKRAERAEAECQKVASSLQKAEKRRRARRRAQKPAPSKYPPHSPSDAP